MGGGAEMCGELRAEAARSFGSVSAALYLVDGARGLGDPTTNAPAMNRTWTCSSGGCRDIHFTTGASRRRSSGAYTIVRLPSTIAVSNVGESLRDCRNDLDQLVVDPAVRGEGLLTERIERFAPEV